MTGENSVEPLQKGKFLCRFVDSSREQQQTLLRAVASSAHCRLTVSPASGAIIGSSLAWCFLFTRTPHVGWHLNATFRLRRGPLTSPTIAIRRRHAAREIA
jgi:hypothetical protein